MICSFILPLAWQDGQEPSILRSISVTLKPIEQQPMFQNMLFYPGSTRSVQDQYYYWYCTAIMCEGVYIKVRDLRVGLGEGIWWR